MFAGSEVELPVIAEIHRAAMVFGVGVLRILIQDQLGCGIGPVQCAIGRKSRKPVVIRATPGSEKDRQTVDITLKEGENEILLKVGAAEGRLGFFFRIADPNGCPLPDLPAQ